MILCCGEALIDMIPGPVAGGGEGFVPHPGGAVFNTAIALGRLGAGAALLSGLSSDFFGDRLRAALDGAGVDTQLAVTSDRPCTLAFVQLVDGQARYAFYDENTAGRMLTPAEMPAIPAAVEALFFGGISLIAEPCGTAYETLALAAAETRTVMLDPNIRPGFIRDEATYRARLGRMLAAADIVKVSDEDLAWIAEAPGDPLAQAEALARSGPALVVVTEGARGATGVTRDGRRIHVAAPRVRVADTVGAGDTFNAGVLAELQARGCLGKADIAAMDDETLAAALSLGAAAAAVTVSRAGANPPWRRELAED